jgi:hypothetical protein
MSRTKYYAIDDGQLRLLRKLKSRLHTEERMNGDEMRDWGHELEAIVRIVEQLEIEE